MNQGNCLETCYDGPTLVPSIKGKPYCSQKDKTPKIGVKRLEKI